MRFLLTVAGLLGLVIFVVQGTAREPEVDVASRYAELQATLDETLAALDRPPAGTVTLVVRAGPRIEFEDGEVRDLDALAADLAASDGAWDDHRVTLDVDRGVTYEQLVLVVDELLIADLTDIVVTGEGPVAGDDER